MKTRQATPIEFEYIPGGKWSAEFHHNGKDWKIALEPPTPCNDPEGPDMWPHYMDIECASTDDPSRDEIYESMCQAQFSTGFRTMGTVVYSRRGIAAFVVPYFPLDSWDRVGISKYRV